MGVERLKKKMEAINKKKEGVVSLCVWGGGSKKFWKQNTWLARNNLLSECSRSCSIGPHEIQSKLQIIQMMSMTFILKKYKN